MGRWNDAMRESLQSLDKNFRKNWLLCLGSLVFIALTVLCAIALYQIRLDQTGDEANMITVLVYIGLVLVVGLMILLIVFYKVTGIADKTQALGLPSGSVRALLAFCLVFMFICLGVFLYKGLSTTGTGSTVHNMTSAEADILEKNLGHVVREPVEITCPPPAESSTKLGDKPAAQQFCQLKNSGGELLFNVTYFINRSKEADDFAKALFAQLGTVFVTVVGFYFGSSTATAGVGAGVAAVTSPKPTTPTSDSVPAALTEAKSLVHDAGVDLQRAQAALSALQKANPPAAPAKLTAAQAAVTSATTAMKNIQTNIDAATKSATLFGTVATDAENQAAAANVLKARDQIKALAKSIKDDADTAEAQLK